MNKHKHYEMIMAWAAGETLEFWSSSLEQWVSFTNKNSIDWNFEPTQYRIKPDKELSENNAAYDQGFVDGMARQRESSVDRAVNAKNRPWAGLTNEEISEAYNANYDNYYNDVDIVDCITIVRAVEAILREKNHE